MIRAAKAVWRRFARTQLWRAWKRYGDRRGNRLAGATTFFGFLSLFPLIVLAAAVTGRLLNEKAVGDLKRALEQNLPGIADKIDIDGLIDNAGTIGLISGVTLLLTGLGWIDSMRASIRSMHELDDEPGDPVRLKLTDLGALLGLGLIGLLSTATTSLLSGLSDKVVDALGVDGTWIATWGLKGFSAVVGILTGAVLFLYLQTGMPRILLPRKVALIAALAGGVVFYGAQKLGTFYVNNVIQKNQAYGALALPLALLVWTYLLTRVIMLIAAWAKEAALDVEKRETAARRVHAGSRGEPRPGERRPRPAVPTPAVSQRSADKVAVAAGAVLGATATAIAVTSARALRSALSTLRR